MNDVRILSLFSGIGAFEKAFRNLNLPYEIVNYSEINKFASKSYSLLNRVDEDRNLWDISKINEKELSDFDLMTYGFPCQDITSAGFKKGIVQGETRSGLLYEAMRIAQYKMPKYMIMENVSHLVSSRFIDDYNSYLEKLQAFGYKNYWTVINGIDFNIPQHRKRVFVVSIREDIKQEFEFPDPIGLHRRFEDFLIPTIDDEKLLHSQKAISWMSTKLKDGRTRWDLGKHHDTKDKYCHCLLSTLHKGHPNNLIVDRRFGDDPIIRKFATIEALRLMGFDDSDYEILNDNKISRSQILKMAGNSIIVPILEGILKNLFKERF